MLDHDGPGQLVGPAPAHAPAKKAAPIAVPDELPRFWHEGGYGDHACPRFVWAHEIEGSAELVSVVSLGTRADKYNCPGGAPTPVSAHFRRLNLAMVRDIRANPSVAGRLGQIAFGVAERGDDDIFIPLWEMGPSGFWGVSHNADRELAGFRALQATRGHERRRLGDLATIEMVDQWNPGQSEAGTLYFVAEGIDVLRTLRRTPEAPAKLSHESEADYEQRLGKWRSEILRTRLLRLHSEKNADYLWLALADQVVMENLRCRASKSYWNPLVAPSVLGDTLIPWPSEDERQTLVAEHQRICSRAATEDVGGLADDVKNAWEWVEREFDNKSNHSPVSARELPDRREQFMERFDDLAKTVERVWPAPLAGAESPPSIKAYPPAPLAIVRRKLDNERTPGKRIGLAVELAETAFELDAAVLFSVLHRFDPARVTDVWQQYQFRSDDIQLALGTKRILAQTARKNLRSLIQAGLADTNLQSLADAACQPDDKLWQQLAAEIVRDRNHFIGHTKQLPESMEHAVAEALVPKCRRFVDLLSYLNQHMLVCLESRRMRRTSTEYVLRMLVHDNALFVRDDFTLPRGTALDTLSEGEVHIHYAEPAGLLSLWPWVLFAPTSDGKEAIWFFDQTKGEVGRYKSSLAPGQIHSDAEAGGAVLRLVRGR